MSSDHDCNGQVLMTTTLSITAVFTPILTPGGGFSVAVQPTAIASSPQIYGCNFDGFWNWVGDVKNLVQSNVQSFVTSYAASLGRIIQVEQSFAPYPQFPDLLVFYNLTSLTLQQNTAIIITATANISITNPNNPSQRLYFDDQSPDINIAPPTIFDQNEIAGKKLLTGLDMSTSLIKGVIWAIHQIGLVNSVTDVKILDADLRMALQWTAPFVGITSQNNVYFRMDYGAVNTTCANAGIGNNVIMLQFSFENMTGSGNITQVANQPAFVFQASNFSVLPENVQFEYPQIPLPRTIVVAAVEDVITSLMPAMNAVFGDNAITLPLQYWPYFPDPLIDARPQDPTTMHGYVRFNTYCSCNPGPNHCFNVACSSPPKQEKRLNIVSSPVSHMKNTGKTLYISSFSSTNGIPNINCRMEIPGDRMILSSVAFGETTCTLMNSTAIPGTQYYSINQGKVALFCESTCEFCFFRQDSIVVNECNILQSDESLFLQIKEEFEDPCFGTFAPEQKNLGFLANFQNNACENIPEFMTMVSTIGQAEECHAMADDGFINSGFFVQSDSSYNVKLDCFMPNCSMGCTILRNVKPNECISNSQKLLLGLDVCLYRKEPSNTSLILKIVLPIIGCGFLVALLIYIFCKKQKQICQLFGLTLLILSRALEICQLAANKLRSKIGDKLGYLLWNWKTKAWPKIQSLVHDFLHIMRSNVGIKKIKTGEEIFGMILYFISIGASLMYLIAWYKNNPMTPFASATISQLGLPDGVIEFSQAELLFSKWGNAGCYFAIAILCLQLFFMATYFVTINISFKTWTKIRALSNIVIVIANILIFVAPALVHNIPNSIQVNPYLNITRNHQDFLWYANTGIGYSFLGISVTYIGNLFLFAVFGPNTAIYLASACYVIWGIFRKKRLVSQEMIVANQVVMWLSIVSMILPSIIIYQSLSTSLSWLVCWGCLWIGQMLFLFHLHSTLETKNYLKRQSIPIIINMISFVACFGTCIVLILKAETETNFRSASIQFPIFIFAYQFVTCFCGVLLFFQTLDLPEDYINEIAYTWTNLHENVPLLLVQDRPNIQVDLNQKQQQIAIPNIAALGDQDQAGHSVVGLIELFGNFLLETREQEQKTTYGDRISFRRIMSLVGTVCFGMFVFLRVQTLLNDGSAKARFIVWLQSLNSEFQWPSDQNGGTIFDVAFALLDASFWVQCQLFIAAASFFGIGFLVEAVLRSKTGLVLGRLSNWVAVILLLGATLSTSVPNYIAATPLNQIVPFCAPQLNNLIYLVGGDLVGVLAAASFALNFVSVSVAAAPALFRSAGGMIFNEIGTNPTSRKVQTLKLIFFGSTVATPFITILSVIVLFQTILDTPLMLLLLAFWILPPLVAVFMFRAKSKYSVAFIWSLTIIVYVGSLIGIIVYEMVQHTKFKTAVLQKLSTPEFWLEIISEITLTLVFISDSLYSILT